ncbi:hypothetical protein U9M48_028368 [Paspalum notatum var. saurae]|uniref:Integrase catalytic domain-containing protein n=1 Tax=Paspalum notatum var. saurae TaxID=547442 RepID=A0AAQ3X1G6_PASNO
MYHDLKEREPVAEYVAYVTLLGRVKAEHRRPTGLLQPLKIRVEMGGNKYGFHYGVTRESKGYNSIRVVVDRLTKVAHLLPIRRELYISRIVCLHGVPKRIISDRGSQFTSRFWEQFHDSLDSKLRFSTAYHPQIDGQTERTN